MSIAARGAQPLTQRTPSSQFASKPKMQAGYKLPPQPQLKTFLKSNWAIEHSFLRPIPIQSAHGILRSDNMVQHWWNCRKKAWNGAATHVTPPITLDYTLQLLRLLRRDTLIKKHGLKRQKRASETESSEEKE